MFRINVAAILSAVALTLLAVPGFARQQSITIDADTTVKIIAPRGNEPAVNFISKFLASAVPAKIGIGNSAGRTGKSIQIHLGKTAMAGKLNLPKMEEDEFVIAFPDEANIVIAGGSEFGVMYGTIEFLERFAGVRWLFPGPLGLHIPKHDKITVPMEKIQDKPVFVSRELSWAYPFEERNNPDYLGWRRFNRMRRTIEFHHNLANLFPPAKYRETHPEFFPIIGGRRVTSEDDHTKWNPLLNAPGSVQEAVKNICEYFRTHPKSTSYSLGINDLAEFDDAKAVKRNSVGSPDYSDYYYGWVNRVAAGVLAKYPDKWLGLLAYLSVTDPPSEKLNPRCVPFICVDRLNWYDAKCAETDRQRTRNWHQAAPMLGWYDYVYGDFRYLAPRVYPHLLGETLKFAAANGVRAYYAENYNSKYHREGPKSYLILKLLWNPELDVDALLDDWYRCAVGDEAAPELKKYFDFWEKYWREEVPKTDWFAQYKNRVYFDFNDKGYIARLKMRDMEQCEEYLKAAVAKAGTPEQKARAEFFLDGFRKLQGQLKYALTFYEKPAEERLKLLFRNDFSTMAAAPRRAKTKFPSSWNSWQRTPGKAQPRWDQTVGCAKPGSLAVNMVGSTGGPFCFMLTQKVVSGRTYLVRCKVKNEGLEERAEISVRLNWTSNGKQYPLYEMFKKLQPRREGEWQTIEFNFTPPQAETLKDPQLSLLLYVVKSTRGQVWFDDVEMYEVMGIQ